MKKTTLYYFMTAALIFMMASCSKDKGTVTISGTVSEGKGEHLALMHLSGNIPVLLDTLTLGADGSFKFQPKVEEGGPDFFCLILGNQTIPLVSDTLQTPVKVTANKEKFGTTYQVEDATNQELQKAVMLGNDMRRQMLNLTTLRRENKIEPQLYADSVKTLVAAYKAKVLNDYIYKDPASPISYYLLFETVSGLQIFDPLDAKDNRAYGAVANLWLNTYPNSKRSKFLEEQTKLGMAMRIKARQEAARTDSLFSDAAQHVQTFFDLTLPGVKDEPVSLSSVNGLGNIVLLDFTAYYIGDLSVPHNQALSEVYAKYKDQGLKIYQVCMDSDLNFWKVSAANIPWIVVRDPEVMYDENGMVAYSAAAAQYNVQTIPTTFVMSRDGTATTRVTDDSKLEAAVAKAM